MPKAEVCFIALKDLAEIKGFVDFIDERVGQRDDARLKTLVEVSDVVYQLTKIPFVRAGTDRRQGEKELLELLAKTAGESSDSDLIEACRLRVCIYDETLNSEWRKKSSYKEAVGYQEESRAWEKAREEVGEVAKEAENYLCLAITTGDGLNPGVAEGVSFLQELADKEEKDPEAWLNQIFKLLRAMGINELLVFQFMTEKQRRRNAWGKEADEWTKLLPVARECFKEITPT